MGGCNMLLPSPEACPALCSSSSAGLQPMLPYLVPLMAQEVGRNLGNAQHLRLVLRCTRGRPGGLAQQAAPRRQLAMLRAHAGSRRNMNPR